MIKQTLKTVMAMFIVFMLFFQVIIFAHSQPETEVHALPSTQIELKNNFLLSQNWLERLNYYRQAAGLPSVNESSVYSAALAKHTNYMLLNVPTEGLWHGETPGRSGYTVEGAQAAAESNLFWSSSMAPYNSPVASIDAWMDSIHHRYGMLNPNLTTTGFALSCNNKNCGAGLNVIRGLDGGSDPRPQGVFYPGANQRGVNTDIILTWQFLWEPTVVLLHVLLQDSTGQPVSITTSSPLAGDYFNMVSVTPNTSLLYGMTYTTDITIQLGDEQLNQTWSFTTTSFADVPFDFWSWDYVERLYDTGITEGCGSSPPNYCPNNPVTRAQMAVFLEKGVHFPDTFSPPSVSPTFSDTTGHWAEDWIEALKTDGITGGCGTNLYCPNSPVTRAQMSIFLLKSKYGSSYMPPDAGVSTGFNDVPITHWAAPWIKQLAAEGITSGCGGGNYCPGSPVNRAEMAVFLVKTFNLP